MQQYFPEVVPLHIDLQWEPRGGKTYALGAAMDVELSKGASHFANEAWCRSSGSLENPAKSYSAQWFSGRFHSLEMILGSEF